MHLENQITFYCHMKRGGLDFGDDPAYELVQFVGYFRKFFLITKLLIKRSCRIKSFVSH